MVLPFSSQHSGLSVGTLKMRWRSADKAADPAKPETRKPVCLIPNDENDENDENGEE